MIGSLDELLSVVAEVYGEREVPKEFRLLGAVARMRRGEPAKALAAGASTNVKRLEALNATPDPIAAVFKFPLAEVPPKIIERSRKILGQLLIGELAERAFEKLYRETMGTHEIRLEDERLGRNETDYRVLNGQGKPVFRINIKFHASRFLKSQELVGLASEDCFALATYKICQARVKQEKEDLNYIFVVVGVPDLTGERVGTVIRDDMVHLAALIRSGKRSVEEQIVAYLLGPQADPQVKKSVTGFARQIDQAEWRVVSATKADRLVREKLFERVYAVRVRAFATNYRNAELDMHFSIREDLIPLRDFLHELKERGLHGISTLLAKGKI